jgi:serine/threonine protein kinase
VSSSIDKENEQKIRREIAILKKCMHPHVVQLMEIMENPESNKIYMGKQKLKLYGNIGY